ncbi:hypothetical protein L1987_60807 [Smallanthus sonchifolius]|uniref:Uncharacterized protein n=1 Tax=Smallanthus sonchifolius TaxID=185202 RepID=A0ACB9D918_9ASTR|nr:hypothetical protein L1987_60807 [Smallanthus sonchifolius]
MCKMKMGSILTGGSGKARFYYLNYIYRSLNLIASPHRWNQAYCEDIGRQELVTRVLTRSVTLVKEMATIGGAEGNGRIDRRWRAGCDDGSVSGGQDDGFAYAEGVERLRRK